MHKQNLDNLHRLNENTHATYEVLENGQYFSLNRIEPFLSIKEYFCDCIKYALCLFMAPYFTDN